MLIECSECKNEISDKAEYCPNCGCPVSAMNVVNYCNINGTKYDLSDIIDILPSVGNRNSDIHPFHLVGIICDKTSLDWDSSKELVDIIIESKHIPASYSGTIEQKTQDTNIPHCPTCGSANIKPITATERATSIIGLGIFSKKINKTYKCLNCKCTW